MQTTLSVIIPGYNTPEAWWQRCVDSVKRALGPDDEIILVDDGSLIKPMNNNSFVSFLKNNGKLINIKELRFVYGDHVCYSDELGYKEEKD